ncbi:hypothetical protein FD25_GL002595 [Levilactobacillus acidifarinae DSM 19394]|uniref:Uncharacterized protein n=1 Tax=Levilactobacillus acidifarinae DSM 19394 = JCM 15949 TaxID=1423715 RepID=A0A0R1LRA1_9LACO|nr:hypothetical protein FD25_GL002595 [Levilactobacillus acidifarinae DSM 19394]
MITAVGKKIINRKSNKRSAKVIDLKNHFFKIVEYNQFLLQGKSIVVKYYL